MHGDDCMVLWRSEFHMVLHEQMTTPIQENCREIIKFANASCRDDDEDQRTVGRCPVLTALRGKDLKKSDPFLGLKHARVVYLLTLK